MAPPSEDPPVAAPSPAGRADLAARYAAALDLRERVDHVLQRAHDVETILDGVMDALVDTPELSLSAQIGAFLLGPGGGHALRMGTVREESDRARVAARAHAAEAVLFPTEHPDHSLDAWREHVVVPLVAGGQPLGALSLLTRAPELDQDWGRTLHALGRQVGVALLRAQSDAARELATRELERARNEAVAADEAKGRFLANMSHELRTPLNAILGYTELLRDELPEGPLTNDVVRIAGAGRHLLTLINSLLDLSKIQAGHMTVEWREVSVEALCRDVADTLHPLVAQGGNRLELDVAEGVGAITSDDTKLRQILINLLGNASKFTEAGHIRLRARRVGPHLVLSVTDTGIGMNREQLAKVFKPFVQADESTTRRFGGTGLGLAVSQEYAQLLGGTLTASSRPGEGSTFTLRLPLRRADG